MNWQNPRSRTLELGFAHSSYSTPSNDSRCVHPEPACSIGHVFPVEKCFALATLALSLLAACGGSTSKAESTAAADSTASATGTVDPPADGEVRSPDLPIEGDDTITVLGSSLGLTSAGQLRWTFTFRNNADEPLCSSRPMNASLRDADGRLLAGATLNSEEYLAGIPAFTGLVMGSVYRGFREDGVVFLDVCVPPGGRGLGFAEVWGSTTVVLPEDAAQLLDATATVGHDLTHVTSGLQDLELAPDLPSLHDLRLVDTPDGKQVEGIATTSTDLARWQAWFALFDANGVIVDVVRAPESGISATQQATPAPFVSAPAVAAATQLELFFEEAALQH